MTIFFALFVRGTKTNNCFTANQSRFTRLTAGRFYSSLNRITVMAIHIGDDLPAIGFKTSGRVVAKPALNITVNGNTIIVIKRR